jgi:hypothetical protein
MLSAWQECAARIECALYNQNLPSTSPEGDPATPQPPACDLAKITRGRAVSPLGERRLVFEIFRYLTRFPTIAHKIDVDRPIQCRGGCCKIYYHHALYTFCHNLRVLSIFINGRQHGLFTLRFKMSVCSRFYVKNDMLYITDYFHHINTNGDYHQDADISELCWGDRSEFGHKILSDPDVQCVAWEGRYLFTGHKYFRKPISIYDTQKGVRVMDFTSDVYINGGYRFQVVYDGLLAYYRSLHTVTVLDLEAGRVLWQYSSHRLSYEGQIIPWGELQDMCAVGGELYVLSSTEIYHLR